MGSEQIRGDSIRRGMTNEPQLTAMTAAIIFLTQPDLRICPTFVLKGPVNCANERSRHELCRLVDSSSSVIDHVIEDTSDVPLEETRGPDLRRHGIGSWVNAGR